MNPRLKKTLPILLIAIYAFMSIKSALNGGDFDVFLHAAEKMQNGQDIYAPPYFKEDLKYFYSPFFAMLLIPFTANWFVSQAIWLLLSGFLLYRSYRISLCYFPLNRFNEKQLLIWNALILLFTIRFLLYNIAMTQMTMFLLWGMLESIDLIRKGKFIPGGLLLSLLVNIKLLPLVAIPYILYKGYWKAFGVVIIGSLLWIYLPALYLGMDGNVAALNGWWSHINPSNSEHLIEAGKNAQSLVGTIPVFLTETKGQLPQARNLLNLGAEQAQFITNLIRLALIVFTLFFLGKPFQKNRGGLIEFRALAYILLLVPLVFPHQQKYAFLFLVPAWMYLSHYVILRWKSLSSIYIIPLIFISLAFTPLIGSDIIGRNTYDLFHHFRILGICSLLLIPYLIISKPQHLQEV